MQKSFEAMASRADTAVRNLIETIAALGEVDEPTARGVASYYIKHKLVRADFAIGRFQVKHGAYFDKQAIAAAVGLVAADVAAGKASYLITNHHGK